MVPPLSEAADELKAIKNSPRYSAGVRLILYAVVSASFTVFFGGNWQDAVVSGILGMILMFLERLLRAHDVNPFLSAFLFSLLGRVRAIFAVEHGLADSMDKISIGNIMLRIPGIMLTNSIRDFFNGDTMTGILRFRSCIFIYDDRFRVCRSCSDLAVGGGKYDTVFYSAVSRIYRFSVFCDVF